MCHSNPHFNCLLHAKAEHTQAGTKRCTFTHNLSWKCVYVIFIYLFQILIMFSAVTHVCS